MHSIFVIAAAFASVVAAQTSTDAPATTAAPAPVAGGDSANPNAVNVPEGGKMAPAVAGEKYSLSWNNKGGKADGGIKIAVVYGPSTALTTASVVFSAENNPGTATFTIPTDIPNGEIGFVLEEEGEEVNYSPQFEFSGGSDAAPSESGSEATATGDASTLETVASTAEPTEDVAIPTGNTTVTGSENTAVETEAPLPTESSEEDKPSSPTQTPSSASGLKVSFAALLAGLTATFFAL